MSNEGQKRIRIVIHELDKGKYKGKTSRNISVFDSASVDEVQNIVLNALARYGIKHKYTWYSTEAPTQQSRN
ncbi:MAG: hypothetical protein ACRD38_08280 [Nitrososphaerales archaeon]|jgi:hypothetical protein|nr:hypothetical protein [Nitrososphaerales archaeon]